MPPPEAKPFAQNSCLEVMFRTEKVPTTRCQGPSKPSKRPHEKYLPPAIGGYQGAGFHSSLLSPLGPCRKAPTHVASHRLLHHPPQLYKAKTPSPLTPANIIVIYPLKGASSKPREVAQLEMELLATPRQDVNSSVVPLPTSCPEQRGTEAPPYPHSSPHTQLHMLTELYCHKLSPGPTIRKHAPPAPIRNPQFS